MATTVNYFDTRPDWVPARAVFKNFLTPNPRTLEQAVHKSVCEIPERWPRPLALEDGRVVPMHALLSLMILCYARQIYGSTDLSDIAQRDEDLARLGGEGFPQATLIRRFRIENQAAVHHCLAAALRFQIQQKLSQGLLTKLDYAQIAEEASRRIIMAAFIDSAELDGSRVTDPPREGGYLFANRLPGGH
jgi:hypothetical protein